jgi:hypothetical protein
MTFKNKREDLPPNDFVHFMRISLPFSFSSAHIFPHFPFVGQLCWLLQQAVVLLID